MIVVAAFVIGFCTSVMTALLLGFAVGHLNYPVAVGSIFTGEALGLFYFFTARRSKYRLSGIVEWGFWEWATTVVFALFALRCFLWLIWFDGDSIKIYSDYNLGDIALHQSIINYFANGIPFWPDEPIYAGKKLGYFVGVDMFNALLVLCGVDLYRGLIWVGLISSILTFITLYRWGGMFTVAGFLFNGGLAGLAFFSTGIFQDYQSEVEWRSIPLTLFVTQRGFQYGIPAGLLLLYHWRQKFFSRYQMPFLPFWAEVLIYSTMPLFHTYTFLFLTTLLAYWFLFEGSKIRKDIFKLAALSLVPAVFLVSLITGQFTRASMIHLTWGWMQKENPFFEFWIWNFGFLPFYVIALLFSMWWNRKRPDFRERHSTAFVIPAVGTFLTTCVVMFATWDWDNMKLMMWSYLILLPFLWEDLIALAGFWIRALSCFLLFSSGFISLLGALNNEGTHPELIQRTELDNIIAQTQGLPIDSTYAASPEYNHPILMSGHRMVAGQDGHVWSHGLDVKSRKSLLNKIMMGETDWEKTAKDLNVRYIFWGPREKITYKGSLEPWKSRYELVSTTSAGSLYDLQRPKNHE